MVNGILEDMTAADIASLATGGGLPEVPQAITFAQLLIGLVTEGWITEAEGEAWLEGRLPGSVQALIGTLPKDQRFAAKARAIRPSAVLRSDPLVGLLAAAQGKTQEQLDAFFITYGAA
jgi:hypothetical protein